MATSSITKQINIDNADDAKRFIEALYEAESISDCSKCKHCYMHLTMWGEYWCHVKEGFSPTKDGYVYDAHTLNNRFKKCEYFKKK